MTVVLAKQIQTLRHRRRCLQRCRWCRRRRDLNPAEEEEATAELEEDHRVSTAENHQNTSVRRGNILLQPYAAVGLISDKNRNSSSMKKDLEQQEEV